VAEGARLESVFTRKGNVGSNPTLSANLHRINNLEGFFNRSATHSPCSFILFRISEIQVSNGATDVH
jgi:hypothetical protein